MIIQSNDISFHRLQEKDIELVRQWRNSPKIAQFMEFRGHITPEMQKQWFDSINNFNNLYFLIYYQDKCIGLSNAKEIDWNNLTAESGIFIADEKYWNTHIPIFIAINMVRFCFDVFEANMIYGRVLRENKRAIHYNLSMGFELCDGQEDVENQLYAMTKDSHEHKARTLIDIYTRLVKEEKPMVTILQAHDFTSDFGEQMERVLRNSKNFSGYEKIRDEHHFYFNKM